MDIEPQPKPTRNAQGKLLINDHVDKNQYTLTITRITDNHLRLDLNKIKGRKQKKKKKN